MQTEHVINSGNTHILKPRKALNKAFLKVKPNRSSIEEFKQNLIEVLDRSNETESEEFHKNLLIDFFKKTWYDPKHYVNTKGRTDLVIHNGNKAKTSVGVIIEAKKPTNRAEMLSREKINSKAFHELLLYYLRERITHKNLEIKCLIATNIYEWFIFDAHIFEKIFAQNKALVKQFADFEAGRLAGKTTDFFYKEIAEPFVASLNREIEFTWFDIRNYENPLRNNNPKDDNKLIALFKLLSPEHLLKLPFTNDSNSLDKRFYGELLHILGLTETKQGGKKLIERPKEGQRNSGSLLENAIIQLYSLDKVSRLENPLHFGATNEERLFNVGLELGITWLNRILFLKLLEAQLITYHKGDRSYEFLSLDRIHNYDDLNTLFFQVLARQYSERNEDVKELFAKVPYLNSSLFEPTDIEHATLFISNLRDEKTLPIYSATVLKDKKGKKRSGELNTLEYLFEFLNAYDFSSEGGEEIQEDNKTLINASVLGLIFEKINGYKDGSFFTPGFITMYMCRETIRKAVVQKFNEKAPSPSGSPEGGEQFRFKTLDDVYDQIDDNRMFSRQGANEIINSLKICDPAVGSGHFLVSALNEIIAIKNDLNILQDRQGRRLKEYQVEVVNDELIVTDEEGELFEYNPSGKESQRVQEALFHEKQTIIENCLFGVDINPNSVKICRLRLWIELLKNTYYKWENDTSPFGGGREWELETLPNIDINIKCGNSLISRFDLDADLSKALKDSKWNIDSYRVAVDTYRNAENKEQKREMEKIIHDIKTDFRSEISSNDPKVKRLQKVKGELFLLTNQTQMFEMSKREKATWNKKLDKLSQDSKKFETEIQEIRDNKIYENAFEWRFEFPEVLNEEGDYLGFDVVIGNPPYVDIKAIDKEIVKYLFKIYATTSNRMNLYSTFVERGHQILKAKGNFTFIIPNSILMGSSYQGLRNLISNEISGIVKLPEKVFEDATVETIIIEFKKSTNVNEYCTILYGKDEKVSSIDNGLKITTPKESWEIYEEPKFNIFITDEILQPLRKIHTKGKLLGEIADFTLGITPYDKYRGHSPKLIKNKEFHSDVKLTADYQPLIKGENIIPYHINNVTARFIKYGDWLGAPRDERFFNAPRVIVRQIVSGKPPKIYAGYSNESLYFTQIGFGIIPKEELTPLELTALLNSKLINFYHKYLFLDIEKELFQKILIENCKQFPCLAFPDSLEIENKVLEIIWIKKENPAADTSCLETEIDRLVYELYGLTEEEIVIVESA